VNGSARLLSTPGAVNPEGVLYRVDVAAGECAPSGRPLTSAAVGDVPIRPHGSVVAATSGRELREYRGDEGRRIASIPLKGYDARLADPGFWRIADRRCSEDPRWPIDSRDRLDPRGISGLHEENP
jgi:hypothetical protein